MSSAEQPLIKPCRNCQRKQKVRTRPIGGRDLMRCTECNHWIRCYDCQSIMAVDHQCEKKAIEVPS